MSVAPAGLVPSLAHMRRAVGEDITFVGSDVHLVCRGAPMSVAPTRRN
jgi:hypothetical protein